MSTSACTICDLIWKNKAISSSVTAYSSWSKLSHVKGNLESVSRGLPGITGSYLCTTINGLYPCALVQSMRSPMSTSGIQSNHDDPTAMVEYLRMAVLISRFTLST